MSTQIELTQIEGTPVNGMPPELAAKGWQLFLGDNMRFRVGNSALELLSGPYPTADEAISDARDRQVEFDETEAVREEAAGEDKEEPPPRKSFEPYTTLLAVHTIDPEVALSMRAEGLNMLKCAEYAEAVLDGAEFPAVDVFYDGHTYHLAGGAHRHQSTSDAKRTEILSTVHAGTKRDALIWAAAENKTHGLPRSNADKRLAVETLLRDSEWVTEGDGVIATHTGVSQPFVGSVRETLETQNIISPQPKRRGKDRVVRDVSNIGGHVETETADNRQATLADIDGVELPPREAEAAGEPDDEKTSRPDWEQSPDDLVKCLGRHGGVLMRMQLEEMGFSYGAILNAINAGVVVQPEIGKFTLPDHKPQPSVAVTDDSRPQTDGEQVSADRQSSSVASGPTAKPKPAIEEILKGRKLSISFVWIPGVPGVNVSVNAGDRPENAVRKLLSADKVPSFPEEIKALIVGQLKGAPAKPTTSAKPTKPNAREAAKTARRNTVAKKKVAAKMSVRPKSPAKKATKKTAKKTATKSKKKK